MCALAGTPSPPLSSSMTCESQWAYVPPKCCLTVTEGVLHQTYWIGSRDLGRLIARKFLPGAGGVAWWWSTPWWAPEGTWVPLPAPKKKKFLQRRRANPQSSLGSPWMEHLLEDPSH